MEMLIKEYYDTDYIDNISDHIPLYILLDCFIAEFTHDHNVGWVYAIMKKE